MEEKEMLKHVADITIGRKIKDLIIPVRRYSILQRVLNWITRDKKKYKVFELYPSVTGNMIRIAERAGRLPDELLGNALYEIALPLISKHGKDVIYIVAAGIQNNKHEPSKRLIEFITWNFQTQDLYDALMPILNGANMQAFMNSTILIKGTDSILKPRIDPMDGSE
jgi:hypothetical protein